MAFLAFCVLCAVVSTGVISLKRRFEISRMGF
jgi:hypothetical protein